MNQDTPITPPGCEHWANSKAQENDKGVVNLWTFSSTMAMETTTPQNPARKTRVTGSTEKESNLNVLPCLAHRTPPFWNKLKCFVEVLTCALFLPVPTAGVPGATKRQYETRHKPPSPRDSQTGPIATARASINTPQTKPWFGIASYRIHCDLFILDCPSAQIYCQDLLGKVGLGKLWDHHRPLPSLYRLRQQLVLLSAVAKTAILPWQVAIGRMIQGAIAIAFTLRNGENIDRQDLCRPKCHPKSPLNSSILCSTPDLILFRGAVLSESRL